MIVKSATFIKSAVQPADYPETVYPEIAFAGRSNVGKSSMINKILNRKHLVKTSSTPGRTQLLNFFLINEAVMFVDFPGYGYAKVPVKIQKKWGVMIDAYLQSREQLKALILIIDIRRTPGDEEFQLFHWMRLHRSDVPVISVMTKTDKLSGNKLAQRKKAVAETLGLEENDLIYFSAKTGKGVADVWKTIDTIITPPIC